MIRRALLCSAIAIAALAGVPRAQSPSGGDGRDADRAAIRAHIESICQAFVDGDVEKIFATHTEDWRGFLESSRTPIKGIDEYMRANGIPWPLPAGTPRRAANPNSASTFKVFDFDVHFYTPDIAVVNFLVDFGQKNGEVFTTGQRYRIMDIYVRRKGAWNQAASHTVVDPAWRNEVASKPATLPPAVRDQLLASREAVWRAYFTNDQAALARLVPVDTIVLQGNLQKPFVKQSEILESARAGAERGNKLTRLEFPQTEIQVYGNTAIVYTTYLYELETAAGQRQTTTGSATEIFVRRGGGWVNPGWHLQPVRAAAAGDTSAQAPQSAPPQQQNPPTTPPASFGMHSQLVSQYRTIQRLFRSAAELMPEGEYAFQPSKEMRPFIRNVGHFASANYGYCANLSKKESPVPTKGLEESLKTKAEALKLLADSAAFCDEFIKSVTADTLNATYTASSRGPDGAATRLEVAIGGLLSTLIAHQNEVYGYTAVYLRLKGLVPPSSAPPAGRGRGGY